MTAELLQNLLNTYTTKTTQTSQNLTSVDTTQARDLFEKAFDNASNKYASKESNTNPINSTLTSNNKTIDTPEQPETVKERKFTPEAKEEISTEENTPSLVDKQQKDFQRKETKAETDNDRYTQPEQPAEDIQNNYDEKQISNNPDELDYNKETPSENQNNNTTLTNIYTNILSNFISDETNTEFIQNNTDKDASELTAIIENTPESTPENTSVATTQLTDELDERSNTLNTIIVTETPENSEKEINVNVNISEQNTDNELFSTTQSITNLSTTIKNQNYGLTGHTFDSDMTTTENDLLVKAEENISISEDEYISDTKSSENSKISQETIESLDVTIREAEASGQNNRSGNNNQQHHNPNSNAQEDIIKMSLEKRDNSTNELSENVEIAEITESPIENTKTSNINTSNTNIDTISKITNTPATSQTKPTSNTDILNQISNNLTLPKDNTTSKVNILLKPENLGKVAVEIMQTKDGVAAKMVAETPQVKELLDKSIESLKNTIASQGVSVSNISVKIEESASSQNANFGFEQEEFNREAANHSNHSNNGNRSNNSENETESTLTDKNYDIHSEAEEKPDTQITNQHQSKQLHNGTVNITV